MNRQIKFRVWNGYEMVEDVTVGKHGAFWTSGISESDNQSLGNTTKYDDYLAVMQFTGLHDKNGKEIYEGDVLNFGNNNPVEVKFENGAFTVFSEPLGWDFDSEDIPILTDFKYCEITGNVFENPGLVKL